MDKMTKYFKDWRFFYDDPSASSFGIRLCGCGHAYDEFKKEDRTPDMYGFSIVLEGCGFFEDDTGRYDIQPGSLLCFQKGKWSNFESDGKNPFQELWFLFDAEMDLSEVGFRQGCYPAGLSSSLARAFSPLVNYSRDDSYNSAEVLGLLMQLLTRICHGEVQTNMSTRETPIRNIIADLRDNPERDWDFQQLAAQYNISYSSLRQGVKGMTGLPPQRLVNRERIHRACELLMQGTPVGQTARRVGFNDVGYFSRYFHKCTGCPPSNWP